MILPAPKITESLQHFFMLEVQELEEAMGMSMGADSRPQEIGGKWLWIIQGYML